MERPVCCWAMFRLGRIPCPISFCNLCASVWLRLQSSECPASCPSGSCFCPAAVAALAQAGLLEALVLAGYFQGPQAPCPTGISSCGCSASGVHGNSPVGAGVPCIFGSQYCKQDGSCTVDWEVQLSTHMVELIAKHLVEFSHEFLEFFFPSKDLMPFIFQYVVWKLKKKKTLKEYSKKEEVFVHREALFFPAGWLFCPSPLLFLPKR